MPGSCSERVLDQEQLGEGHSADQSNTDSVVVVGYPEPEVPHFLPEVLAVSKGGDYGRKEVTQGVEEVAHC